MFPCIFLLVFFVIYRWIFYTSGTLYDHFFLSFIEQYRQWNGSKPWSDISLENNRSRAKYFWKNNQISIFLVTDARFIFYSF